MHESEPRLRNVDVARLHSIPAVLQPVEPKAALSVGLRDAILEPGILAEEEHGGVEQRLAIRIEDLAGERVARRQAQFEPLDALAGRQLDLARDARRSVRGDAAHGPTSRREVDRTEAAVAL